MATTEGDLLFCVTCAKSAEDLMPAELVECATCEVAHCSGCDHWCEDDDDDEEE